MYSCAFRSWSAHDAISERKTVYHLSPVSFANEPQLWRPSARFLSSRSDTPLSIESRPSSRKRCNAARWFS